MCVCVVCACVYNVVVFGYREQVMFNTTVFIYKGRQGNERGGEAKRGQARRVEERQGTERKEGKEKDLAVLWVVRVFVVRDAVDFVACIYVCICVCV